MIFGANFGRGYSGSYSRTAIEESILSCLTPSMATALGNKRLEAIAVFHLVSAFKVLPIYGLESILDQETLAKYDSLKKSKARIDIHIVHELDSIRFIEAVVPFKDLFDLYAALQEEEAAA